MDLTSHVAYLITQVCNKAVFIVKVPKTQMWYNDMCLW